MSPSNHSLCPAHQSAIDRRTQFGALSQSHRGGSTGDALFASQRRHPRDGSTPRNPSAASTSTWRPLKAPRGCTQLVKNKGALETLGWLRITFLSLLRQPYDSHTADIRQTCVDRHATDMRRHTFDGHVADMRQTCDRHAADLLWTSRGVPEDHPKTSRGVPEDFSRTSRGLTPTLTYTCCPFRERWD